MLFKKKEKQAISKQISYPFNVNVSFEVAFKALKEGYLIKVANYSDIYMIMVNNKIIEINARNNEDNNSFEIEEFDVFAMLMNTWQIVEPNTQQFMKK